MIKSKTNKKTPALSRGLLITQLISMSITQLYQAYLKLISFLTYHLNIVSACDQLGT